MRIRNAIACAAGGAILRAAGSVRSFAVDAVKDAATIDAAAMYMRHCSACHVEKGDGNSLAQTTLARKPRNFTAEESRTRLTREYMLAIVCDGRPHTPMMARSSRLSQEEIEAVVDFVRSSFMSAGRQAPPVKAP